jgi:diketogulonate reductase-like aldo/keto reductase
VQSLVRKYGKTKEQIFFQVVKALGIIPLSGTTSAQHMQDDLDVDASTLEDKEVLAVSALLF